MSFKDKVVLVTGASSGIGAAIAIKFAAEVAKVAIVGRNEEKLKAVAQKCEQVGSKPLVIVADVSNEIDAKRIISDCIKHFRKIDVLINNAGVGNPSSILDENAMTVFDKIMAVNLRAPIHLTHLAATHLIQTKGNVINISSIVSMCVMSSRSFAYATSKASLDHFTRNVALELAPKGVRVNSINPGFVKTNIIENFGAPSDYEAAIWESMRKASPFEKLGEPEEIAELAAFLASDKARGITGSSYVNDNGSLLLGGNIGR